MPDPLTGLPLIRDPDAPISPEPRRALWIDVAGLIWLNDQFGFEAGDRAIVQIAELLKRRFARSGASIVRVAGDEFLVFPGDPDDSPLEAIAKEIIAGVDSLGIPYRRLDRAE